MTMGDTQTAITLYDAACRAVAEARSIDEVKEIHDQAAAMREYARQAKKRDMEADAVEIRMRALRRLDQLRQAQKGTVGLNQGAIPGKTGLRGNPVLDPRPTLASQGIDKNLAHQSRVLGALSGGQFEQRVAEARDSVNRVVSRVVNAVAIEQEREAYRARTYTGGTVEDLEALARSGERFGVICPDFPWDFEPWSESGKQRSAERHYNVWSLERIKAFAPLIGKLAAPDCALLLWAIWPLLPAAFEVINACGGFEYKTDEFVWVKTTKNAVAVRLDGDGLHWGKGLSGSRSNTEPCLVATRGSPRRLSAGVHQVVLAPVGEHSAKPDKAYRRIEQLYPGPYLELFARRQRDGWTTWGNELPAPEAPPADTRDEAPALDKPYDGRESESSADSDNLAIPTFLRRAVS
jgi:N6-adenosine-specific RNA methylase IME4